MKYFGYTLVCYTIISLVGAGIVHAHKVTIFAWAEGGRVVTQSKFRGGKAVKNGKVAVYDSQGRLLLEGQTDDSGEFSFQAPVVADLTIVLSAGMGHQNSWKLSAAELGTAPADAVDNVSSAPLPEVSAEQAKPLPRADAKPLTVETVEGIVARQLEAKLRPLTRMMVAAQTKGPTFGDIMGGIGYIIGLVGAGAYMRYRKETRQA
jgi:nickel transport protein